MIFRRSIFTYNHFTSSQIRRLSMGEKRNDIHSETKDHADWIALIKGDKHSFENLFKRHYSSLHQYGYKLTGDASVVDDCLQEMFLYIFEKRQKLGEVKYVRAYLFKSFRRLLLRTMRNRQKLVYVSLNESWKVVPNELEMIETQERQRKYLVKLINELSPREREMIYMRYYNDLSIQEIAEVLSISYRAVVNTLYKAMVKLRENRSELEKLVEE